jgi:uncharacterized protein
VKSDIDDSALGFIQSGDYGKAIPVITATKSIDDAEAWGLIAALLFQGDGVDQRKQDAIHIWTRLADAGDAHSSLLLGLVLIRQPSSQSVSRGVERLKLAAELGDDEAMGALSQIYYSGVGPIPADGELCVNYLRMAADKGNTEAMLSLAHYYRVGDLVPQSYEESLRLNRLAAERGNPGGNYNLGLAYERGYGVAVNESVAFRHYELAAANGVTLAQHNLGVCYYNGKGTIQDRRKAVAWYLEAAAGDSHLSQHCLGLCFYHGEGVDENVVSALAFFLMAVDNGGGESKPFVSELLDSMDQRQVDSALEFKQNFKRRYREYYEDQPDATRH